MAIRRGLTGTRWAFPPHTLPPPSLSSSSPPSPSFCTALGYLIYFWLIVSVGPTRAITVTFLAPAFGVLWGVLFLGELLTWSTVVGFAIILAGTGFVTGIVGRVGRKPGTFVQEDTAVKDAITS